MQYSHLFFPRGTIHYPQAAKISKIDHPDTLVSYLNDSTVEKEYKKQKDAHDVAPSPFMEDAEATKKVFTDALIWPYTAIKNKCVGSYVVFAAVTFFVAPAIMPDVALGESFAAGYVAGGLTYYYVQSQVKQLK